VLRVAKSFGQMSQSPVGFVCLAVFPGHITDRPIVPSSQIGAFFCISGACAILTANCTQMASNLLMQADLSPPHLLFSFILHGEKLTRTEEWEIRIARQEKEMDASVTRFPCWKAFIHFPPLTPLFLRHNAHCRLGQIKQPVFPQPPFLFYTLH